MLITTRLIERSKKGTNPAQVKKLEKELKTTRQDLNSILSNWKFGDQPIKSAQEFLKKFTNWINEQLEQKKQLEEFYKKYGITDLNQILNITKEIKVSYKKS